MSKFRIIVYHTLAVIFIVSCAFSFIIYTSLLSEYIPWHDPCGMQFLAIVIISCPAMFITGIIYLVLSRYMQIRKTTILLPFITAAIIGSLLFIDGSLGLIMQLVGATTCVAALAISIFFSRKDYATGMKPT